MRRSAYYEKMKSLARVERERHGLDSPRVMLSALRRIYKEYGIRIDYWPYRLKDLRGAYFNDHLGPSVLVAGKLPSEPKIFTLAHELKHHLVDGAREISWCLLSPEEEMIEIGAEVFAAELIFPEAEFREMALQMGIRRGGCSPEEIVRLKRESATTLSYMGLAKRAYRLGFAKSGSLDKIKWRRLDEDLYGVPIYKKLRQNRRNSSGPDPERVRGAGPA